MIWCVSCVFQVMNPTTALSVAHGVGASLQRTLEELPEVERAFVHIDVQSSPPPEHLDHSRHGP
jgi:hypothetical protein